jgi:hypothetical protein
MYACMYVPLHAYTHTHVHTYLPYIHAYIHAYMHTYMRTYVLAYMQSGTHNTTHTYTQRLFCWINTHTYRQYIHIHTHPGRQRNVTTMWHSIKVTTCGSSTKQSHTCRANTARPTAARCLKQGAPARWSTMTPPMQGGSDTQRCAKAPRVNNSVTVPVMGAVVVTFSVVWHAHGHSQTGGYFKLLLLVCLVQLQRRIGFLCSVLFIVAFLK